MTEKCQSCMGKQCWDLGNTRRRTSCTASLLITSMLLLHALYARIQNNFSPAVTATILGVVCVGRGARDQSEYFRRSGTDRRVTLWGPEGAIVRANVFKLG